MNMNTCKQGFLSLLLLGGLSLQAFAENRDTWFSDKHYTGNVTLDAAYGDKQNSHGIVDLLYPLYQRSDAIGFVDIRGMLREGSASEFNLGGGYRWLNDSQTQLYGVYGFYDAKQSVNSKNYTQLTFGGEWKMANYSLGGNVYIPMGTQKNEVSRKQYPQLITNPAQADTFLVSLNDDVLYEYAYQGLDIEAGYQVPQLPGLTTYVGAYHFTHKDADAITGPRLSVEYDVLQHIKQAPSWLDSVDVVANVQHDAVRETLWSIGMRVSIPLGTPTDKRTVTGLQKALTSVVRRDKDIVTSQAMEVENDIFTKADGTPFVGKMVTTPDALLDVTTRAKTTGLAIDIVAVAGNLSIPGVTTPAQGADGLLTTATIRNTDAAVVLTDKQILTGGALTLTHNGNVYSVPVVEQSAALAGASATTQGSITLLQEDAAGGFVQTGHLLRVGQNNRIEDIALIVPAGNAANNQNGQQSAAITNTMGIIQADDTLTNGKITYKTNGSNFVPFGSLTLQDVTVTGGGMVYLNVDENAATESTVTIDGGTYNITNPYVGRSYEVGDGDFHDVFTHMGAITLIDQGDGDEFSNHQLSAMTINYQQDVDAPSLPEGEKSWVNVAAISASHLSGEISGNSITATATGARNDVAAIMVSERLTGAIGCDDSLVGTVTCGNTITKVQNSGESDMGGISNAAFGIYTGPIESGGRISGNSFGEIAAEQAFGVHANDLLDGGVIGGNTFNGAITGDEDVAFGIRTFGTVSGTISGNQFTGLIRGGKVAAGIKAFNVDDAFIFSGTIGCGAGETDTANCKNTFGTISASGEGASANGIVIGEYIPAVGEDAEVLTGTLGATGKINGNEFGAITSALGRAYGIKVFKDTVKGSEINNNNFTGTITSSAPAKTAAGNYNFDATASVIMVGHFDNDGKYVADTTAAGTIAGNVAGNTVNAVSAVGESIGIDIGGHLTGTIGCAPTETDNCANKFGVIESKEGWAAGVFVNFGLGDGTAANAGHIRGNTFEQVKGVANFDDLPVSGISVAYVEAGSSISGNQFGVKVDRTLVSSAIEAVGAGTHAAGITIFEHSTGTGLTGTIGCGATETESCANKFGVIKSAEGYAAGVWVNFGLGDGTVDNAGHIRGNTFELVKGVANVGVPVSGILVLEAVNTGSSISGNQFGVKVDGTLVSSAIEAVGAGVDAAGITFVEDVTGTIGCGADETDNCANKFGVIESKQGWAAGVWVKGALGDGTAANAGHIRGNTFEQVKGAANHADGFPVSGIVVAQAVNAGSSISGNQFGVKVNGDSITGNAIEATAQGAQADVAGIYTQRK